eukprot:UN04763
MTSLQQNNTGMLNNPNGQRVHSADGGNNVGYNDAIIDQTGQYSNHSPKQQYNTQSNNNNNNNNTNANNGPQYGQESNSNQVVHVPSSLTGTTSQPAQQEPPQLTSIFMSDMGGIRGTGQAQNKIYFLGIIDVLQVYNWRKKGENWLKSLRYDADQIYFCFSR